MADARPRASAVAVPGASLRVERRGDDGPCAVFVHGLGGALDDWDAVRALLDPGLCSLAYDRRGDGRSTATRGVPFSHADDLLAVLDAEGIACCDLIGVSAGGAIALNVALDHPGRVRRLVLVSPALVAWEWSVEWRAMWRPIVEAARAGRIDEARSLWWRHPLFDMVRDTPAGAALRASIDLMTADAWTMTDERPALPDVDRLPLLSTPTLLLTGGRDHADFRLIAALIEGGARDVRRLDLPDAGHMLHIEAPRSCAGAIGAFLSSASLERPPQGC